MDTQRKIKKENQIVTGSSWMAFGSLLSKVLGAIYIIPWMMWMGNAAEADAAHTLYQIAYTPYAFFLAFATAGVPAAISKQISYFNAQKEYEISKKIYKQGLFLMAATGIVSAALLFILAPKIAAGSPVVDKEAGAFVIRSLVPALLIIPAQSVTRGLFQGHNRMREPAISQVFEQLARVIFILASAFIIRQVLVKDVVTAVAYSTFAAFIGAFFSIAYLLYRLKKIPTALNRNYKESRNEKKIATRSLLIEIIKTSIPFVVISTGLIIFQLIDQQTFAPIMNFFNPNLSEGSIQINYGIIQANAHKLSTIITSFGTALAITSVPIMSDLIAKKDYKEVAYQFQEAIQLLMFIMIPAIIGVIVVAEPFYTIFYSHNEFGVFATKVYAITSLFMALYMVLGNILQAVNLRRKGIYALVAGILAKIIAQPIFLRLAGEIGMLYSTIAGLLVTIILMFKIMNHHIPYSYKYIWRRILLITIFATIMGIVTKMSYSIFALFLNYESRFQALIGIMLVAGIGLLVYGYLALKSKLAEKIIGEKASNLKEKLGIK
ncbi:MAG: polysaccharide biosynthesis protein [Atopostipes sp.]|nr:polysaccharide biosynthesis protein [Atopostipes sp.]